MSQTSSFPCRVLALRLAARSLRFAALRRVATGARALALLVAVALPAPVAADVVLDWSVVTEAVAPRFGGPQQQSRVQAMVQIAVHDALNAIEEVTLELDVPPRTSRLPLRSVRTGSARLTSLADPHKN